MRVLLQTFVIVMMVLIVGSLVRTGVKPSAEPLSLYYATMPANDSLTAGDAVRLMGEPVGVVYSVEQGEAGHQTVAIAALGEREFPWADVARFEVTYRGIMHREYYVNAIPRGMAGLFEKFRGRVDEIVREAYREGRIPAPDSSASAPQ